MLVVDVRVEVLLSLEPCVTFLKEMKVVIHS